MKKLFTLLIAVAFALSVVPANAAAGPIVFKGVASGGSNENTGPKAFTKGAYKVAIRTTSTKSVVGDIFWYLMPVDGKGEIQIAIYPGGKTSFTGFIYGVRTGKYYITYALESGVKYTATFTKQ